MSSNLRITCLIPSATDICVLSLGLAESVVGVTHECDLSQLPSTTRVVTADRLDASSLTQAEIHERVCAQAANATCTRPASADAPAPSTDDVPSLYPILPDEFLSAAPTIVLTQDLCAVCAPTTREVHETLASGGTDNEKDDNNPLIVSLGPETLEDIPESIRIVASACNITDRGDIAAKEFQMQLETIQSIVQRHTAANITRPRMLLLEWLDPPMDGGHWIPEMMEYAGVDCADLATSTNKSLPRKSQAMHWQTIQQDIQPNVILVACCGFDLQRNHKDILLAREQLAKCKDVRVVATNGDLYFARPGPRLVMGTAIMATAAYGNEYPALATEILQLPFMRNLDPATLLCTVDVTRAPTDNMSFSPDTSTSEPIGDLEDAHVLHARACAAKESFYKDPESGYMVFTEHAHKLRGKCCGSGCRHCPYSHVNVRDKASKIQQPAMIYAGDDDGVLSLKHGNVRVLFFSGGKDSFLALRALARQAMANDGSPFGVCLLTTFDASSRVVAHQDIHMSVVERQARHLGVALVGVPMHRASSEGYVERVRKGLDVLEANIGNEISAFVFGDLHLEHIVTWRKENLGSLGYELQSPLLNVNYDTLAEDLERSGVPCIISSSTIDGVSVGDSYNQELRDKLTLANVDLFGENGEFHTEARVWEMEKDKALHG
ncbi:hypothetical protein MPSEU_000432200 [Mayamaea pseudoterrestris]|nr:hypothetical protein MPSEU_000432200 [Mayamaea pseudoterrestris]